MNIMRSAITVRQSDAHPHSLRRAFTLIELIVVIGIIVLLMALIVGVSTILHAKSETRQVENTLKLLEMAVQEWELAAERQMSWGPHGQMIVVNGVNVTLQYDINSTETGDHQMSSVLEKLRNTTSSREILARIDAKFLIEVTTPSATNPRFQLVDPWGKRMVAVHPGRVPNVPYFSSDNGATIQNGRLDPDGTIRTDNINANVEANENRLGICQSRRIMFVSSGPDGELGNLRLGENLDAVFSNVNWKRDFDQATDNIYSSPPLLTRPTS